MPRVCDHLAKSAIRLLRQSTTVPNTSNTSAFTAEISDMVASPFFVIAQLSQHHCEEPLRRSNPSRRTNEERMDCFVATLLAMTWRGRCSARGMTGRCWNSLNPGETFPAADARP